MQLGDGQRLGKLKFAFLGAVLAMQEAAIAQENVGGAQ